MKKHSGPCCVILLLQDCYLKVNGPHHGLKIYTSSRSGRTPPWVKNLQVHEVNGPHHGLKNLYKFTKWTDPNQGQTYTNPKMDGPKRFAKLYKSITWAAIRGHDHFQRSKWTRLGSQKIWRSTTWTDQIKQVFKASRRGTHHNYQHDSKRNI